MSRREIDQAQPDPLDTLLTGAFEQALAGPDNEQLIDQVMARINRQQRQRTLVLILCGLVAGAIAMFSAIPLLTLVPSDFLQSLLASISGASTGAELSLPVTVIAAAIMAAGGWLLLDEATA